MHGIIHSLLNKSLIVVNVETTYPGDAFTNKSLPRTFAAASVNAAIVVSASAVAT